LHSHVGSCCHAVDVLRIVTEPEAVSVVHRLLT
jgi:hypothetical protein